MSRQVFRGAAIFDGRDLRTGPALVVEDGVVAGLVAADACPDGENIDLDGGILAPGFIDLQINGGGGVMLNDAPNLAGLVRICAANALLGTTGLLPTLITDRPDVTRAAVEAGVAAAAEDLPGFLGLHLEGPHLDPRRKGAHDPALIRPMTPEDLAFLCDAAARLPALLVTLAPANATVEQIAALAEAGAIVSLGQAEARAAEARAAFVAGARMVTHLFNAMSPLGHREPGLVGAALDSDVHAGLIADGVHVDPATMRIALAAKRERDRIFLVTDAMAVAGTDLDEFNLNGRRIRRRDGPHPRRRHACRCGHRLPRIAARPGARRGAAAGGGARHGDADSGRTDRAGGANRLPRTWRARRSGASWAAVRAARGLARRQSLAIVTVPGETPGAATGAFAASRVMDSRR